VETELRFGYLGTAKRKGRQQTTQTYDHRATSRLYHFESQMSSFATLGRRRRYLPDSGRPATRPPAQYEVMP
jgi:hypothetical protein